MLLSELYAIHFFSLLRSFEFNENLNWIDFFFFFIHSTVWELKTQRLSTSASFKGSEKECGASSGAATHRASGQCRLL